MSLFSRGRIALLGVAMCLAAPAALAQGSSPEPDHGSAFQCEDGSKLYLDFAETEKGSAAMIWFRTISYVLPYLPPEPGPVQIVWSDGEHSLTWMPGVRLMWMGGNTHLMCGRGGHKH